MPILGNYWNRSKSVMVRMWSHEPERPSRNFKRLKGKMTPNAQRKRFRNWKRCWPKKEGTHVGWPEVREVVDLRRKILETETRRLKDSEATLTMEQGLTMIGFLNSAIRKAVNAHTTVDIARRILVEISRDFGRLVGVSDDASARPAAKVIN